MIHLHPTPTFPLSPVTAVVPDRPGLVPVVHVAGVPVPTWREACIHGRSTEVVAVVPGGAPLTVEYLMVGDAPIPTGPIAPEMVNGLALRINANESSTNVDLVNFHGETHCATKVSDVWHFALLGAPLRIFTTTYAGLPMVELALAWINGDTESPQGARLVNRFEIVPPQGWAVVSMTPSERNGRGGTLEQGRRRDMRVCLVPDALAEATRAWVASGAGRLLALNDAGEIVTPHPNGARWTRPGDKAREASLTRMVKLSAYARDGAKLPELLAYGESTAIPTGWRDAIGQPYGGKTGGQQFAPLMWDVATNAGIAFKYLETLRTGVADRCLYLTTGGEPVTFDAGLSFAIDMNAGARLFSTRGTSVTRQRFFDAPDDPGTERNPFGSIDWQHGSARFGPSEIMATLWNDPLAKYGLALDAAMARIETTEAEVRAKSGALGRAEAWMAHVNALDLMFNDTSAARLWLESFAQGVTVAQRENGGVCAWEHNKEAKDYARAFVAKRDGVPIESVPVRPVSQPWQDYALAHGLRMAWRAGVHVDTSTFKRLMVWALFTCRDPQHRIPYRVFLDGTRASDESDGMHLRWALGMLAELTRDLGLAAIGVDAIQTLLGLHVSQWRAELAGEPNAELLMGVLPS